MCSTILKCICAAHCGFVVRLRKELIEVGGIPQKNIKQKREWQRWGNWLRVNQSSASAFSLDWMQGKRLWNSQNANRNAVNVASSAEICSRSARVRLLRKSLVGVLHYALRNVDRLRGTQSAWTNLKLKVCVLCAPVSRLVPKVEFLFCAFCDGMFETFLCLHHATVHVFPSISVGLLWKKKASFWVPKALHCVFVVLWFEGVIHTNFMTSFCIRSRFSRGTFNEKQKRIQCFFVRCVCDFCVFTFPQGYLSNIPSFLVFVLQSFTSVFHLLHLPVNRSEPGEVGPPKLWVSTPFLFSQICSVSLISNEHRRDISEILLVILIRFQT